MMASHPRTFILEEVVMSFAATFLAMESRSAPQITGWKFVGDELS